MFISIFFSFFFSQVLMLITYFRRISFMTFALDVFAMNETVVTIIYQVLILSPLESKHSIDLLMFKLPQITHYYRLLMFFFFIPLLVLLDFHFWDDTEKLFLKFCTFEKLCDDLFGWGDRECGGDKSVGKFHWFCWVNVIDVAVDWFTQIILTIRTLLICLPNASSSWTLQKWFGFC